MASHGLVLTFRVRVVGRIACNGTECLLHPGVPCSLVPLVTGCCRSPVPKRTTLRPSFAQVMTDPVITPSGETYERQAIEQWLETHGTDPQTRRPLTKEQLIPNRRLKETVEVHKKTMALTL